MNDKEISRMDITSERHDTSDGTEVPTQAGNQSDTAALSLFGLRRKGVQMVLTMMLGTALSMLIIILIFLGFNRVEGTVESDLTRLATTHDVPAGAMARSLQEMSLLAKHPHCGGGFDRQLGSLSHCSRTDVGDSDDRFGGMDETDGARGLRAQSPNGRR